MIVREDDRLEYSAVLRADSADAMPDNKIADLGSHWRTIRRRRYAADEIAVDVKRDGALADADGVAMEFVVRDAGIIEDDLVAGGKANDETTAVEAKAKLRLSVLMNGKQIRVLRRRLLRHENKGEIGYWERRRGIVGENGRHGSTNRRSRFQFEVDLISIRAPVFLGEGDRAEEMKFQAGHDVDCRLLGRRLANVENFGVRLILRLGGNLGRKNVEFKKKIIHFLNPNLDIQRNRRQSPSSRRRCNTRIEKSNSSSAILTREVL